MADNVTVNTLTGSPVVATDDDGTAHHQYVKLEFGADNTQTKVSSTVGLPVNPITPAGDSMVDDTNDCLKVSAVTVSPVSGNVAHDSANNQYPVVCGAHATASVSGETMVTSGDATRLHAGIDGVQIVRPHCNLEDIVSGNASNTDGTSTSCIAAGAAGIKHYLVSVCLTNTSSSMIYVEIKDGATAKVTLPLPASSGCIYNPPVPIPGTAATAWNFDPSAATTTVYCSMVAFKSKV